MTITRTPLVALGTETMLFASRLIKRWCRQPIVPVQALLLPTILLITYKLLAGNAAIRVTGTDNLYGLVPVCALAGAMFGALGAAGAIPAERDSGLLARLSTFPVNRASPLTGRLVAEAARTIVGTLLITSVGMVLGFHFAGGWVAALIFLSVPVLVVVVFSTIVITVALRTEAGSGTVFTWLGMVSVGMVFCSAGVARVDMFPGWLRPLIELQPMTPTIQAMRALAEGKPALAPLVFMLGWFIALAALFVPLAVRRYRGAAESAS